MAIEETSRRLELEYRKELTVPSPSGSFHEREFKLYYRFGSFMFVAEEGSAENRFQRLSYRAEQTAFADDSHAQ